MTMPDERHDDLRDEEVSQRYRALSPALPQPGTDAAIRAAARAALAHPSRRLAPGALYGGLAMAASVTLMLAILLPSWRTGELQQEVAVRAPVETLSGERQVTSDEDTSAASPDVGVEMTSSPVPAAVEGAAPSAPREQMAAPAARVPVPVGAVNEAGVLAELRRTRPATVPAAPAPAPAPGTAVELATADMAEAASPPSPLAGSAPVAVARPSLPATVGEDAATAEQWLTDGRVAAREAQKAAPAAMAKRERQAEVARPAPQAGESLSLEALLQADRYGDALALLQGDGLRGDATLASRRDLLRQLVPGQDKALTCRAEEGPAAARALCLLLTGHQAGRGVPAVARDALYQALMAEGTDPAPWLRAVSRLP